MTDHNFDCARSHADAPLDIDELIARSSLGTAGARAVRRRVAPGRAEAVIRGLTRLQSSREQAHDGMELDEIPADEAAGFDCHGWWSKLER